MPFGQFSKNYNDILSEVTKGIGFDAAHFANQKLKKLRQINPSICDSAINFLDYGCGIGNLCKDFHDYFPKANYFGVDISHDVIGESRSTYSGKGEFYETGSDEWKGRSYDLIFTACVFHHIPSNQHENILTELRELLLSSGKIILWEHNPLNPFTRKIVRDCIFDKDAVLISPNQMRKMFAQTQLSPVQIIYTTFFPSQLGFLSPLENILGWLPLGGQYVAIGQP